MAARSALFNLLDGDTRLVELGFSVVYTQNSVDTPMESRFIVIRWEQPDARAFGTKAPDRATVWFHDKDRDYGQIDLGIERVKEIVRDAVHVSGGDGWVLTQAHWNTDGPDLFDDGFGTVTRWTDITVISRYDGDN
jgi:hypothetical protein